jgi:ferredoxin
MKRKIIQIDEDLCNGCGQCIPNCHEGALQIIDGKARLISDLFCDGLGACLGHCPEGAIEIIERDAEPYDEKKVMEILVTKGRNTILAHLEHLRDHKEDEFLKQAVEFIKDNNIDMSIEKHNEHPASACGCPGSMARDFRAEAEKPVVAAKLSEPLNTPSELRQWPVQLHLLNPQASYFKNADVVLAADCAAFAMGDFHSRFLKNKTLAIACPKLDSNQQSYLDKLVAMISDSKINSLTVVRMEVPCCGGLTRMAQMAVATASKKIPIKQAVISASGEVIEEDWVF